MFALPYRPVEQSVQLGLWESSLDRALALGADHISAYSLKLEPGTPLYRRAAAYAFPDEELEEQMYAVLCDKMRRAGLRHYEISNFARPGAECRHNLKYWTGKPYLGLGPAAHSISAGQADGGRGGHRRLYRRRNRFCGMRGDRCGRAGL